MKYIDKEFFFLYDKCTTLKGAIFLHGSHPLAFFIFSIYNTKGHIRLRKCPFVLY